MSPRFKTDENLKQWLAAMLVGAGYDASTVAQQGLCGHADHVVADACRREGRCLITLDVGFGNPLVYDPREYAGIVLLRVPDPIQLPVLRAAAGTLIGVLDMERGSEAAYPTGKLLIVQPGRVREYQHPDDAVEGADG